MLAFYAYQIERSVHESPQQLAQYIDVVVKLVGLIASDSLVTSKKASQIIVGLGTSAVDVIMLQGLY